MEASDMGWATWGFIAADELVMRVDLFLLERWRVDFDRRE